MNITRKNRKSGNEILTPGLLGFAMILSFCLLGEIFFATWCGVQCRRTGYEIAQVQAQKSKLHDLQKKLQIERVRLQSPQILGRYVKDNLNLIIPEPDQIVIVP